MQLQQGLVTIAIPAYKSKWLAEAIESVLSQDYENIELIVVDDHSPYGLENIVSPYLKDKRVRYYCNKKNLGRKSIVLNWNKCVDLAHGEFFVLLCDDDILLPSFVSSLLSLAKKYPKCNVFHGRRVVFDDSTGDMRDESAWPEYEDFDCFLNEKKLGHRKHTITEFLYRTWLLKKEKYEVYPSGYFSDDASILKLVKYGGIVSFDHVVCQFRNSKDHISGSNRYEFEKAKAALKYYKWYQTNIDISLSDKDKYIALNEWLSEFYWKANTLGRVKILNIAPSEVWGYHEKLRMFLSLIKNVVVHHIRGAFRRVAII